MCGLIGAFRADGGHLQKLDHFMWQGLFMSALRGMGGTGVGIVHSNYEMDHAKSHVSSPNFLCSEEWDWIDKNLTTSRAVLGHTRSATAGSVSTKNSHPFAFEKDDKGIMMIHNGHIKNWSSLTPLGFAHPVDSCHVAHSLFHKGALETLQELEGAYTLIWYDKKTKTINLARNEERELFFCTNKENNCFWFASELDMLSSILRRNGIPHVGGEEFEELPKLTLCSYDLTKKIFEPTFTKYEEKKYQPALRNGSGGLYGKNNDDWRDFTKTHPLPGDHIFVNVRDDDDTALVLYKEIGDGEYQVEQRNAYGYVFGTRSMDYGSIIKLVGIRYNDWHDRLKYIKTCLPGKILRIDRNKPRENGEPGTYTWYECTLDYDAVALEIRRMIPSLQTVITRRLEEKERKEAIASGRALPSPSNGPSAPGGVGVGTPNSPGLPDMGSNDGGGTGGRILRLGHATSKPAKVPGPKGTQISYEDWEAMAIEGCYLCEGVILDIDIGQVEFWQHPLNKEDRNPETDAEYSAICPLCKKDPKRLELALAAGAV